ncbi:MAG: hypothetical protein JZU53_03755 [Paludibacter sp.]|nr:hypothetical protein [Paludibacter sp.]
MNTNQFKSNFYLQRVYGQISNAEIFCRLIVKQKLDDKEITGIETKINTYEIGQSLADSRFTFNTVSWGNYWNQTITMLFNLLMLRLNIEDIYNVDGYEKIAEFFYENPFHKE